uniref:RNA polymerase sigma factor n=1 Tax=Leersia perrieri TaxID=77586 RepID=A0A0D9WKG5_9ORYZ
MGGGEASGGGGGAEQEQKRAAAAAYDYEGDARWADYWSNVLVPPHLASRPDVLDHFKRKFYQRYIDRDLVVEPMSATGSTQPSRPEVRSSSSSPGENVRARTSGSSSRSAAPPPPPQTDNTTNPLRFDARTIHFSVNAWVLVVAGLGMLPILPKHLADRACKLSLLGTIISSAYSLYSTHGVETKSVEHACSPGLVAICTWNQGFCPFDVLSYALHVSVALEDFAVCGTTSVHCWRRSIIQTFMYWHVLKLMYHAPVTASYHQSVWAKIGRIVNPYIHRYAPFLNTPISTAQRWWLRCVPPKNAEIGGVMKRRWNETAKESIKGGVDAERRIPDDTLDRKSQIDWIEEDISSWMDRSCTSSNSEYNLLMQNIHMLESSLAGKDLVRLERDILVHIERLGALKSFNASMSRATLTQTYESEFSLPWNIIEIDPEIPLEEKDDQVIVRSGKSQERKLKRMRASEKGSRISVKAPSRKSKKSSSSQFIAEWKNYPGRRRSIIREQSALLVTIKECANLERIRENLLKDGSEVTYARWAKAAGVDEALLKSRLQEGYCCRERLLVTTEWLVKYIARTYTGMGTAFEDLLQAGKMGVLDGAEKFDSQKGCKFSTYVKYWIRKAMLALLVENSGVIQLPARMEGIIRKVKEARRAIRYNTGRYPPDAEIATLIGVSVANVRLARKCSRRVVSLDMEIGVGQNAKFVEVTPDTSLEAPDEAMFRRQLRERLLHVLDRLPPREGHVLKLRHGLEDGKCRSLEQIGSIYHVSKEWIRKIEKSAMSKLRNEDVRHELKDFCGF